MFKRRTVQYFSLPQYIFKIHHVFPSRTLRKYPFAQKIICIPRKCSSPTYWFRYGLTPPPPPPPPQARVTRGVKIFWNNKIMIEAVRPLFHLRQGVTKINYKNEPKKCGGRGGVAGSQPMSTAVQKSPNKLWRSNSIFNLWLTVISWTKLEALMHQLYFS